MTRTERIAHLRRTRPRRRSAEILAWLLLLAVLAAWATTLPAFTQLTSPRTQRNIARFQTELTPAPVRTQGWSALPAWTTQQWNPTGRNAMRTTYHIAVCATVLAALLALTLLPLAARNIARREPFTHRHPGPLWNTANHLARATFLILRSLPEYILAFLLVGLIGLTPWAAILALALHNAGILGRLGSETIENINPATSRHLLAIGANRRQLLSQSVAPTVLPRLLVYFFYRWETCVREATVIGMLGVTSLGYYVIETRARMQHDHMLYFIILGATLVLLGDLASALVRHYLRRT